MNSHVQRLFVDLLERGVESLIVYLLIKVRVLSFDSGFITVFAF